VPEAEKLFVIAAWLGSGIICRKETISGETNRLENGWEINGGISGELKGKLIAAAYSVRSQSEAGSAPVQVSWTFFVGTVSKTVPSRPFLMPR